MNNFDVQLAWWNISQDDIVKKFSINVHKGLSDDQIAINRSKFGSNVVKESKQKKIASLIGESIKEPMILLLLGIAVLSLIFGKVTQAIVMVFVVIAYIVVEFINTARTDRTMTRLKALAAPSTKVMRNGKIVEIDTHDIVVGDILILSEGVFVPADARLLDVYGLMVNEASLTGESLPVKKNAQEVVERSAPLAERINCIFSGTTIINGQGTAVVFAVGEKSEFGIIAQRVQQTQKERTVLQESMTRLAKILAIFALLVSVLIPAIGFMRGFGLHDMMLTWLSLTFLMIPGQPPIIITMSLALAAFLFAKKEVIVKRLCGVEIIGQVTVIVSDKTGTITESKMSLEKFLLVEGQTDQVSPDIQEKIVLALPAYCDDATDQAVFEQLRLVKKKFNQIGFTGFSDQKPWRDLSYRKNGMIIHAIAGSPELLIAHSTLSPEQQKKLKDNIETETRLGKRVIAYGLIENNNEHINNLEHLQFIAAAVIHDPVRSGVKKAISILEKAGITTIIVTGDSQLTAQAVGKEIGVAGDVLMGTDIATMNDEVLARQLAHSHIFARMDPLQKVRLVKILQKQKEIVAVIGDGVNDAPALKTAHVGIAMGRIGTDLAKEVSDLILTDDNYVHIPDAVALGRMALDNFKKGLSYYLSAKLILLVIFLVPLLVGIPFPFVAIHIILIELLMDLASSTIFVTEAVRPDIMEGCMQSIKDFLGFPLMEQIIKNSIGLSLGIVFIYLRTYAGYEINTARTAAFVAWLLGHIFLALNLKQAKIPLIVQGFFSNYFGVFWLLGMILFSLIITSIPFFYPYLHTTWLPVSLWLEIMAVTFVSTFWIEALKVIRLKK